MRTLLILAIFLAAPLMLAGTSPGKMIGFDGAVSAAEQKKKKKKKARKIPPMTERTYKSISDAQLMIDPDSVEVEEGEKKPEPKGTIEDAVVLLLKLAQRRGLNSNERAQAWNTLAFAYYTMDDTKKTLDAYEQVLNQGLISYALELAATRALYQLHFGEENYKRAIEFIDRFQELRKENEDLPDLQALYLKATAYYQLEDFRNALTWSIRTEDESNGQGRKPKEPWIYLQVVIYNELKDIDNSIRVLEKLLVMYPAKQYWMHLAAMYGEKNLEDRALSAYHAAYSQGMLTKESEVVMLSQRLLNAEVPFEAAQVLEGGFKAGVIKENEKNVKLLAMAYTMSQDSDKAIDAWRDASRYSEDGESAFRLAQALANEDRHKEAAEAYRDSLKRKLKNKAEGSFWLAISLMQMEDWDASLKAFRVAAKDKKMRKSARLYIKYVTGERRRQIELKKMLEDV
jgi:tetratricopeptide (TPR) repeat protein